MTRRRERNKPEQPRLNQQLEAQQMASRSKEQIKKMNLWKSEVMTDMAKLVFAGVIIGGVFEPVENTLILYGTGIAAFMLCIFSGYSYYKRSI